MQFVGKPIAAEYSTFCTRIWFSEILMHTCFLASYTILEIMHFDHKTYLTKNKWLT